MKMTLKKALLDGTLHRIFFWIGCIFLFGFLSVLILIPLILSLIPMTSEIYYMDYSQYSLAGAVCLAIAVITLLLSHFLPSRKHRGPHSAVPEGSDQYLDQENGAFSSEEREAILQESWMSSAERFNRNRMV